MATEHLRISADVFARMLASCRDAAPAEAVGVLGGDDAGGAIMHVPLPNRAPLGAFWADPRAQFVAERLLGERHLELIAIYHSHPGGGPTLSIADIAFASRRSAVQVVVPVGLNRQRVHSPRAYRVSGGLAIRIPLEIGPPGV